MCCDGGVKDTRPVELRRVAERVVSEAAEFVRRRRAEIFGESDDGADASAAAVWTKSTPTDPVTVVDTETEQLVRDLLARWRPGDPILGEEGGGPHEGTPAAPDAVRWVVDPIDGTVNFVYGIPAYAVSVAAQRDGVSVAGAVADISSGEVYSAAAGLGAQLLTGAGCRPIRCSRAAELSMTLLGTGFGYEPRRRAVQSELLAHLVPLVRDVRRVGSAALDLCMVAAGRLDAHYEHGLNVWDWAAGALIAAEAGAVVVLPEPGRSATAGELVVAAAPGVAAQLLEALDRFGGLRAIP